MFEDTYRIAGLDILISSVNRRVHDMCAGYRVSGASPVIEVNTTQADIDLERQRYAAVAEAEGRDASASPDDYIETLAVYRQIAERSPFFNVFLFHGSALAVDGEAYIFTAKSGTGKSTHAGLWRELLGERVVMINDDKPLIRLTDSGAEVCGTPWNGKHRLGSNISVPVKGICLLNRGTVNSIRRITPEEAYPRMIQQTYRPADGEAMGKTLQLLDGVMSSVSLWYLECNMDLEAAEVSFGAMKGSDNET